MEYIVTCKRLYVHIIPPIALGAGPSSAQQPGSSSSYPNAQSHTTNTGSTSTGGGFWTGTGVGALLGYMFGSSTNTGTWVNK